MASMDTATPSAAPDAAAEAVSPKAESPATSPAAVATSLAAVATSPAAVATSPAATTSPTSAASPTAAIEADDESAVGDSPLATDDDEGLASDAGSSASTSLSSSVRDYVFENNRRYHSYQQGRYLMPNDEPEQEREDMKHAMIVNVCDGRLHMAPLVNPQRVLDIGTGTGIWAVDMGDEYPEAEVIGIDLSPIQPSWVPPNVRFMVDDAEADWLYGSNTFDYIHARFVCMAIKDWPTLLGKAYDALKPGGWVELQELRFVVECDDHTCPPDYGYTRFTKYCMDGFRAFGVNPLSVEHNSQLLADAGFTNVTERIWKVPIGTWPRDPKLKTAGLYNRSMLIDALQAVALAPLTRGLKWTPSEVELFLIDVRRSLQDSSIHTYLNFHAAYGQKPQ